MYLSGSSANVKEWQGRIGKKNMHSQISTQNHSSSTLLRHRKDVSRTFTTNEAINSNGPAILKALKAIQTARIKNDKCYLRHTSFYKNLQQIHSVTSSRYSPI